MDRKTRGSARSTPVLLIHGPGHASQLRLPYASERVAVRSDFRDAPAFAASCESGLGRGSDVARYPRSPPNVAVAGLVSLPETKEHTRKPPGLNMGRGLHPLARRGQRDGDQTDPLTSPTQGAPHVALTSPRERSATASAAAKSRARRLGRGAAIRRRREFADLASHQGYMGNHVRSRPSCRGRPRSLSRSAQVPG